MTNDNKLGFPTYIDPALEGRTFDPDVEVWASGSFADYYRRNPEVLRKLLDT